MPRRFPSLSWARAAILRALGLLLPILLPAHSYGAEGDWSQYGAVEWETRVESLHSFNRARLAGTNAPLLAPLQVCIEVSCGRVTEVNITPAQAEQIHSIFQPPVTSAEEERAHISRAIAMFEQFVGAANGSWNDRPKNTAEWDEEGQLDCVDEATNTQTYLERLSAAGLLRHHDLGQRRVRFSLIFQHFGYEIIDRSSGTAYIVDSWVGANGEEPLIETYAEWRSRWGNL